MIGKQIPIKIYSVGKTKDIYGTVSETLTLKAIVNAVVSNPSSKKRAYANSPALLGKYIIYTDYINIDPSDRIELNGKKYKIAGITNPNMRGHHLEISLEDYTING